MNMSGPYEKNVLNLFKYRQIDQKYIFCKLGYYDIYKKKKDTELHNTMAE